MKILSFVLLCFAGFVCTQFVSNVHLMGHIPYMIKIVNGVVKELESKEWSNLKLPDVNQSVNETVLDHEYSGTITFYNGFVVGIQHLDLRQSGVDQVWSWNDSDQTGTVLVRGTMRMTDLKLGYDVSTGLTIDPPEGGRKYTVTVTVPLVLFTFNIRRNVNTEDVQITVEGSISSMPTSSSVKYLPMDSKADVLTSLFNGAMLIDGILSWGDEVLAPIALKVYNSVEFPKICYDCPLAATMT